MSGIPGGQYQLQEHVTCSVCMEEYNNRSHVPKLLACQHTFCEDCLSSVTQEMDSRGPVVECPICRRKFVRPSVGFITNRVVLQIAEQLQEALSTALSCDTHDGRECVLFCMDCLEVLCVKCLKGKQHNAHQLEEVDDAKRMLRTKFDARIRKEQADVDRHMTLLQTSVYSSDELKKAEVDLKRMCDQGVGAIKTWQTTQATHLHEMAKVAKAREDIVAGMKQQLKSLLDQSNIDLITMIAKLNNQRLETEEYLLPEPPKEYNFDQMKANMEINLRTIFNQTTSSKTLTSSWYD